MILSDLILYYIVTLYVVILPIAAWGAFSPRYDANLLQRMALGLYALWGVWRISLIMESGWGFPHEWLVATAMALFAVGTLKKTLEHWRCRHG